MRPPEFQPDLRPCAECPLAVGNVGLQFIYLLKIHDRKIYQYDHVSFLDYVSPLFHSQLGLLIVAVFAVCQRYGAVTRRLAHLLASDCHVTTSTCCYRGAVWRARPARRRACHPRRSHTIRCSTRTTSTLCRAPTPSKTPCISTRTSTASVVSDRKLSAVSSLWSLASTTHSATRGPSRKK